LDAQFIAVYNKITAVLIGLAQSTVSSNMSWYVFLFICAPVGVHLNNHGELVTVVPNNNKCHY
jgi:hypothetical protein